MKRNFFCSAAFAIAALVITLAPVFLGCTAPRPHLWIEIACTAIVSLVAVSRGLPGGGLAIAGVIALIGLLQTVSLSESLLRALAPSSAGAWKSVGTGLSSVENTLSLAPAVSWLATLRLVLATLIASAIYQLAQDANHRKLLIRSLALSGALVWAVGIAFPPRRDNERVVMGFVDFAGPIDFWLTPDKAAVETAAFGYVKPITVAGQRYETIDWGVGDGFGSYVISNHFANAMGLLTPALIAVVLQITQARIPQLARIAIALAGFACAAFTVGALADSRAGFAALVMGSLTFLCLLPAPRWVLRVALPLSFLYCLALTAFMFIFFGQMGWFADLWPPALQGKIAGMLADSRVLASAIAARMLSASPWFGMGLGCYGVCFSSFQSGEVRWYFAHNDYAQWAGETGLLGIALLGFLGYHLLRAFRTFLKTAPEDNRLMGAAAWAALAALAVHSAFDWNLHVPANAFLASVVTGIALSTTAPQALAAKSSTGRGVATQDIPWNRCATYAAVMGAVAMVPLFTRDCASELAKRQIREALTGERLVSLGKEPRPQTPDLLNAISSGERAAQYDPANAQLAILIGQAFLHQSAKPQPIDAASAQLSSAKMWFDAGRRKCAVCLGLPRPTVSASK